MTHLDTQTAFANLVGLGFTSREAEFLYLIGTNTGVFTSTQYCRYTGARRGWSTDRLAEKLSKFGFLTAIKLSQFLTINHLHHKKFYAAILTPDSRLRRRMSLGLMHQRLQYADFIVSHPAYEFIGPEAHKVAFFCETLGLDATLLPTGEWKSRDRSKVTERPFPERFPIFVDEETGAPTPGFVYGEDPSDRFSQFRTFLAEHRALIQAAPSAKLIYISPNSRRREMAHDVVRAMFAGQPTLMTPETERYFTMRRDIESGKAPQFSRDDAAFWASARRRFNTPEHEHLYLDFCGQMYLSGVSSCAPSPTVQFETFEPFTRVDLPTALNAA